MSHAGALNYARVCRCASERVRRAERHALSAVRVRSVEGTESERRRRAMRMSRKRAVKSEARGVGRYADAFARVRLVRAWIAAAAAMLTMLYGYVTLLERVVR